MVELRLDQLADKMEGTILQGSPALSFRRFNIDSRKIEPGNLFFALKAARDGHDFVPHAIQRGASGAVVSHKIELPDKEIALIRVKDTLVALQNLAQKVLAEHRVKVVGITGSIGKTTTKEFCSALLSSTLNVLKSERNFNNLIGLPLSILKLNNSHQVAVLEMAMSAPGEIRALTRVAPPDVAVITNIRPVHLQFFKSIEEIGLAKKEILEGIKPEGTAVLNGDDPRVKKIADGWDGERISFGLSPGCDIRAENIQKQGYEGMSLELIYGEERRKIDFPFFYDSFLYNLLAAAATAYSFSVPLDNVLEKTKTLKPISRRGVLIALKENIKLIDDSYNSNPDALRAALKSLAELPSKRRVAVLGDMLELGKKEKRYHHQAGKQVVESGWDFLITVGPLAVHMAEGARSAGMRKNRIHSFQDSDEAAGAIWSLIHDGDLILVKGSHGIHTEKIVDRLKSRGP